jgi:DNA-dependent RNA polymerase auxiliary subunit epsilon
LNQNITEYKQKVDDLLAKDEMNMKYISALEKAVLECKKQLASGFL